MLKIKQISDFVSGVAAQPVGTATATAIGVVQSDVDANQLNIEAALSTELVARASAVSGVQADVDVNQSNIEAALSTELVARAGADVTLSTNLSTELVARAGADGTLSTNLAAEAVTARSAELVLRNDLSTTDGRVTTLLGGSTAALDTFGEIKGFIDGLSTEDVTTIAAISTAVSNDLIHDAAISIGISTDVVHAADIISGDAASLSSAKVYTDAAELAAVSAAGLASIAYSDSADVVTLASAATAAEAYADQVEIDAVATAAAYTDAAEADAISTAIVNGDLAYDSLGDAAQALVDAKTYADTAEADAISTAATASEAYTDAAIVLIDADFVLDRARLTTLEGTIIEDNEMFVEAFVGAGVIYAVANAVQDNNRALVNAFVNGQRVEVLTATGTNIELVAPGYSIVASDEVIISYQAV